MQGNAAIPHSIPWHGQHQTDEHKSVTEIMLEDKKGLITMDRTGSLQTVILMISCSRNHV